MTTGSDSYVQVAADGSGKQIDMSLLATNAGSAIYRQRAELVGDAAAAMLDVSDQLALTNALLRAILFALSNGDVTEDQFI